MNCENAEKPWSELSYQEKSLHDLKEKMGEE